MTDRDGLRGAIAGGIVYHIQLKRYAHVLKQGGKRLFSQFALVSEIKYDGDIIRFHRNEMVLYPDKVTHQATTADCIPLHVTM